MENRFFEMSEYLEEAKSPETQTAAGNDAPTRESFNGVGISQSFGWARSMSVQSRVLVVLIENGGVDLGIPALVDKLLTALKVGFIPDSVKNMIVDYLHKKLVSFTDNLIETAELTINRYNAAKPDLFGNVIVLRNGNATYQELKETLTKLTKEQKIIDLFILTHGSSDYIALSNGSGIDGDKIRDIRKNNGSPLSIRSVYMMNCVGSSLNKAWLDSGAKVSSGAIRNNYMPEPTMFFFWSNWKAGQNFENAVTSAYRKTINLMNDAVKAVLGNVPLLSSYAGSINFENFDFVKDSAPVIQGQRSVTISTDDLSFTQSLYNSLATTVLPVDVLDSLSSASSADSKATKPWRLSQPGVDLIKKFEGFKPNLYNDPVGHCTIGYGTLIHQGNCNGAPSEQPYLNGISDAKATDLLVAKAAEFEKTINDNVSVDLTQNQFDALVSFTYNVGSGAFKQSTLLKVLNQGKYDTVPSEMKKWTKGRVNGQLVDLPGLVARRAAESALFAGATALAQSLTEYSRPFYDTGEHAIFGEFINNAVSGPIAQTHALQPGTKFNIKGVPFTYGQIITMGDFYDSYTLLSAADPTELNKLKTLIDRSENHYKNTIFTIGSPANDVSNAEWKTAIGSRFIDLALKNNSHFAPPPAGTTSTKANNKQSWEKYHTDAINAARKAGNVNALDPVYPINAFGDHFLTDAFSAGHLVNKEYVMNKFIGNMISGSSVSSAGDKLLEQVANGALSIPAVKRELGKWEVTETSLLIANKHFNLDTTTPNIFYRVLKGILEDTAHGGRDQIANLAAKAVHDYLNEYGKGTASPGVPVRNNKGMSWLLAGDGTLRWDAAKRPNNLEIIQMAVKQSVTNLEDAIANPTAPVSSFFPKVWDYVPILTDPGTKAIVDKAINIFTDPTNPQLLKVAILLVSDQLTVLLEALRDAGKIRSVNTSWWG